jgi:hypothetical protein
MTSRTQLLHRRGAEHANASPNSVQIKKPKILLATTVSWPAPARLVSGFASLGCEIYASSPSNHALRRSAYLSGVTTYHPLTADASLRDAIARWEPDLVIPCDDRAVLHLMALFSEAKSARYENIGLTALIERSLGRPAGYPNLMSRASFIQRAQELGIRTPETRVANSETDVIEAIGDWKLPLVVKRDHSWGGTGVRIANTTDEALAVYREWTRYPSWLQSIGTALRYRDSHSILPIWQGFETPPISLQQFVQGSPATTAFASWRGRLIASIHANVLVTERAMGPSCVVRHVECPEMEAAAGRLAQAFGLSGLHGLDYVRDAGGKVHLLEINPRATVISYLPLGRGHDLLLAMTDALTGTVSPGRKQVTQNDIIALFPQELVRDPNSAFLRTAYHDIPDDDPGVLSNLLSGAKMARLRQELRRYAVWATNVVTARHLAGSESRA